MSSVLICCNIFYTKSDAVKFIKTIGVLINNEWSHAHNKPLKVNDYFSICSAIVFFKFIKKIKNKIIMTLKKIKFYKYRIKGVNFDKKNNWISIVNWLHDYSFLYTNKQSTVEFDIKTFTGCYLYLNDNTKFVNLYQNTNITLYMSRSYNWKYLT